MDMCGKYLRNICIYIYIYKWGLGLGFLGGGDLPHGGLRGSGTLPKRCPKSDAQHGAQSEPIGSKRDTKSELKSTTNWTNGASDASFEAGSEKVQKIYSLWTSFFLLLKPCQNLHESTNFTYAVWPEKGMRMYSKRAFFRECLCIKNRIKWHQGPLWKQAENLHLNLSQTSCKSVPEGIPFSSLGLPRSCHLASRCTSCRHFAGQEL